MKRTRRNSGTSLDRLLGGEEIFDALAAVAQLSKTECIPVALAGGVAMQLYGSDRLTKDVDIFADEVFQGIELHGPITFGGESTIVEEVPLDVIVRSDDEAPLYQAALEHACRLPDVPVPVVTREYLAAIKFAAGRGKDLDDLAFLLLDGQLDVARVRSLLAEYLGAWKAREFKMFVEEITTFGGRIA